MTVDPEPVPSPRRVAVVGAGPAGLYAAEELVRQDRTEVRVDLFDRLPTPYGLVRYGVAPDHQKIKSIIRQLRRILDHPAIRFLGGVEFGTDVTRRDLLAHYDAVLYAAGASVGRRLGVPGEELPGCCSATDFVAWYSGHPDVTRPPLALDAERVAVVGAGNVALDVARVLTRSPAELERTDMPEPVLAALRGSAVREVVLLARRGPEHARFTAKELRELGALDGVEVAVDPAVLPASDAGAAVGVGGRGLDLVRAVQANLRVLGEFAARGKRGAPAPRRIELRFLARRTACWGSGGSPVWRSSAPSALRTAGRPAPAHTRPCGSARCCTPSATAARRWTAFPSTPSAGWWPTTRAGSRRRTAPSAPASTSAAGSAAGPPA
ncbi:FAD-dependent oxidoreductase [Phaeacidiphilus oryzae]|uniref:FAD-dependent oxidoreductase n=1 Tax=Phaeacidiphilus oryzae TaxID=348818 RepID=UPI0007C68C26|nr:FAD-dependent oxidoreductase [Phaeacidiphilus oryzae]